MNAHAPNFQAALGQIVRKSRADGRGRVFAVCAAEDNQGTSYCARGLSVAAGQLGFGCLLVDMDISKNSQYKAVTAPDFIRKFGQMSGPFDCAFGQAPFWRVSPTQVNDKGERETDANFMALHTLGQGQISVTEFLWDKVKAGQNVNIAPARTYWHVLRDRYALTIIDVPALSRSQAGTTVFGEVDGTIVISANTSDASTQGLLAKITEHAGKCVGVVLNSAPAPQPVGDMA